MPSSAALVPCLVQTGSGFVPGCGRPELSSAFLIGTQDKEQLAGLLQEERAEVAHLESSQARLEQENARLAGSLGNAEDCLRKYQQVCLCSLVLPFLLTRCEPLHLTRRGSTGNQRW